MKPRIHAIQNQKVITSNSSDIKSVTPRHVGDMCLLNNKLYISNGETSNDWKLIGGQEE